MSTQHILETIKSIRSNVSTLHIYFIERIKQGKNSEGRQDYDYILHKPEITSDLNEELIELLFQNLEISLLGKELTNFDPTCYEDATIEQVSTEEVGNFEKLLEAINSGTCSVPLDFNDIDFSQIWAYCIFIQGKEDGKIYLFKKYSQTKVLKGFNLFFYKGALNKFENRVISIDERVDVFSLGDKIYILNRYFFELIFNYTDHYLTILENGLESVRQQDLIEGFGEFYEACLESNRIAKTFTKIMRENGLETYMNNKGNIPGIIQDYELNVQFVDGKLIYEDKSTLPDIIKLLSNSFVEAALDKRKYEAIKKKPR